MFFGMSICIVLDKLTPSQHLHGTEEEKQPLKGGVAKQHISDSWESILWINFPTLFDLFATGCGTTGLLYTSVSVYQVSSTDPDARWRSDGREERVDRFLSSLNEVLFCVFFSLSASLSASLACRCSEERSSSLPRSFQSFF